jgi:hypothetical protein
MRKLILAAALACVAVATLGALPASSETVTNAKHFFWAQGQYPPSPDQLTNNIIWHGGNAGPGAVGVLTKPRIYLVYWGTEWAQGFKIPDTNGTQFSSRTLQIYLNSFAAGLGRAAGWASRRSTAAGSPPERRRARATRRRSTSRTPWAS